MGHIMAPQTCYQHFMLCERVTLDHCMVLMPSDAFVYTDMFMSSHSCCASNTKYSACMPASAALRTFRRRSQAVCSHDLWSALWVT